MRHDECAKERAGHTGDRPGGAGSTQRAAAFLWRVNNSENNERESRDGAGSYPLNGASSDELHHRARDGAERTPDREHDNTDEISAAASPSIRARSPDRH